MPITINNKSSKLTDQIRQDIIKLAKTSVSKAKEHLAQQLGTKKTQTNKYYNAILNEPKGVKISENKNGQKIEVNNTSINNLEDVLKATNVDRTVWDVDTYGIKKETRQIVVDGEKTSSPVFDFNISLKKKVVDLSKIIDEFKDDLKSYSPKFEKIKYNEDKTGLLLEICAFDLHLGKLSHRVSDGQDYDTKIAISRFKESITEIVNKALKFGNIQQILFPIGNDFLTVDNDNNTTTALTPQSVDTRFSKTYKTGRELLIWAIDYLKLIAPVKVICIPGNHETNSMFHLADALECWYKNDNNSVVIDNSSFPRKWHVFGDNLIIYDHGDKIKPQKLITLASIEIKEWSSCKHREVRIGHWHNEQTVIDQNSCIVRIIPALTGTDNYHNIHGFVGAKQRAQAFLWHPQNGLSSILYSTAYN